MSEELAYTPLITQGIFTTILNDIDNKKLVHEIQEYGYAVPSGDERYNWSGFIQYEDTVCPRSKEFEKLEKAVIAAVDRVGGRAHQIDELWAILLDKGKSVMAHCHHKKHHIYPEEYFSVSYYPQVPDGSAALVFSANWCGYMNSSVMIEPKEGMLTIFNSYLNHMTTRHNSSIPRIVISMNLSPVKPNIAPNADWSIYQERPIVN